MRREPAMRIELDARWRVRASCEVELPLNARAMWNLMRDFAAFCRVDPLHRLVRFPVDPGDDEGTTRSEAIVPYPPRGANIVICHRLFGVGPDRIGRVLRWREGIGFAFSDLSQRGVRVGFPHVCSYDLTALRTDRCVLSIGACGVWTARRWPRWLVRWWLRYVLLETARMIRLHVNRDARWRGVNRPVA